MEWLILLLLVPAIVVPVVLLLGFAGCHLVFGVDESSIGPGTTPSILSAEGTSVSTITVRWVFDGDAASFEVERSLGTMTEEPVRENSMTFEDTGLEASTTYSYRVRAIFGDGEATDFSPSAAGTTLAFVRAFEQALFRDEAHAGECIVQRIEPGRLVAGGTQVRLTLVAASDGDLTIDRVTISRPSTSASANPYDSSADPIDVAFAVTIPQGSALTIGPIEYELDQFKPLLIAFDIGTPGNVRYSMPVLLSEAAAFIAPDHEAGNVDRQSNYIISDRVYLVESIEVG